MFSPAHNSHNLTNGTDFFFQGKFQWPCCCGGYRVDNTSYWRGQPVANVAELLFFSQRPFSLC